MDFVIKRIKELRIAKNLSQDQMAEAIGVNQSNYGKLERGDAQLTLQKLFKIAEYLEVPPFMLLYRDKVDDEYVNKEYYASVKSMEATNQSLLTSLISQKAASKSIMDSISNYRKLMEMMIQNIETLRDFVNASLIESEKIGIEQLKTMYPEITEEDIINSRALLRQSLNLELDFRPALENIKHLEELNEKDDTLEHLKKAKELIEKG